MTTQDRRDIDLRQSLYYYYSSIFLCEIPSVCVRFFFRILSETNPSQLPSPHRYRPSSDPAPPLFVTPRNRWDLAPGPRISASDGLRVYNPLLRAVFRTLFATFIITNEAMDTPAVPLPRDPRERAILDQLVMIRDQLLLLKQDRTNYIRAQDVLPLFDQTMEQVKELNLARVETGDKDENRCGLPSESGHKWLNLQCHSG